MISDQGGDEGQLSTYGLNRFGAEDRGRSPPPLGTAAFAPPKPRGEEGAEYPPPKQCLEHFSKVEATFSGPTLGNLAERQTHGVGI